MIRTEIKDNFPDIMEKGYGIYLRRFFNEHPLGEYLRTEGNLN
jgi:hypothetical protein